MTLNKAGPLFLNAVSAVCRIAVNKTLMTSLRFQWGASWNASQTVWHQLTELPLVAVTLCALHFTATSAASSLSKKSARATIKTGRILSTSGAVLFLRQPACLKQALPFADALLFTVLSNCSISALNVSLHLNSVGTYQVRAVLACSASANFTSYHRAMSRAVCKAADAALYLFVRGGGIWKAHL